MSLFNFVVFLVLAAHVHSAAIAYESAISNASAPSLPLDVSTIDPFSGNGRDGTFSTLANLTASNPYRLPNMPITLLFRPAPTTLDRTDASMCMTDMMVLAFDTVLRSHTDVELTPDGLRVIYNALSFRIYPIQAMALRLLKASTVVAVLRGMVFFMNQEGFTYKSVGIYHDQAGPIGVAKFER